MANLDHYLPCENYQGQTEAEKYPGFTGWFNESDGNWYFAATTNLGRVVLRSEGYSSEAGRNNGIESVMRNRDIEERYSVIEEDGEWFISLKAGNRQEIARSCAFDSEGAAVAGIATCFSTYVEEAAAPRSTRSADFVVEDYLACEGYAAHDPLDGYSGFTGFEEGGLYYFALVNVNGDVLLRSEGYTTQAARTNGVESVMRNRDLEERYKIVEENGVWYLALRAGNHQEIGRSCGYASEEDARAAIARYNSSYSERSVSARAAIVLDDYLPCENYAGHDALAGYPGFTGWVDASSGEWQYYFAMVNAAGDVLLRSEAYTTEAARNNGVESVMRNRDNEDRYKIVEENGQWHLALRAGNNQEIGRSCGYESAAAAQSAIARYHSNYTERSAVAATRAPIVIEDYLHCDEYRGKTPLKYAGFTGWQDAESRLFYFANVDENGKVILKSEGYTTEASRNNGVESVMRNREIKERWVQRQDEHGYYFGLLAGNRQEIARTCHYESESALLGWWMPFSMAWGGELVDVESKPELESFTVESRAITTPVNIEIQEEEAPVEVVVPEPEPEIEAIVPIIDLPEPEPEIEIPAAAIFIPAAAAAIIPEIEEFTVAKEAEVEKDYTPQWKKKEEKTVIYTKPVETPAYIPPVTTRIDPAPIVAETTGGGFKWWWLLPLLLIPLFFLWRGCDGCSKPKVTPPTPPPPVETPKIEEPKPAPVPAPLSCNCNASTHRVFNMSNRPEPKSLTRLGTNPEFGNSHGLDGKGFFDKLTRHYGRSKVDKTFLDEVFTEMGYANGFADAKAEMFTEVTLTPGTVGNMGYHSTHKTAYDRLDTKGKDLEAFRVKAANGCDMHFMKTCGNHFFFCPMDK